MRLQDIIHETWDFVGSSLNTLVEAANNELLWASDVTGCSLKKTVVISENQSSVPLIKEPLVNFVPESSSHAATDHQTRKRADETGHDDSKRQRSDLSLLKTSSMEISDALNSVDKSHSSANTSLHEQEKDDKKQVKVLLKGRTRHKAKELLYKNDKTATVQIEVPKITSPTTKVVNLASKADESRLNSDKRLQSTVSSSLDILRKGLMKKPILSDQNQSIIVESGKRIVDSSGHSLSSIENTSFVRSSNPEIPGVESESLKLSACEINESCIPRESTAIDRLSKIRPIHQLKSLAMESASLEKDRKLVLGGLQEAQLKSQQKTDEVIKPLSISTATAEPNISHIPTLKELKPLTPLVSKKPLENGSEIQNTILDALDKPDKTIQSKVPIGKSCILDENGNLPEIQSEDSDEDHQVSPPKIANWAHTPHLRGTLETQKLQDPDAIFGSIPPIHLEDVFKNLPAKKITRPRASSGVWDSLTPDEIAAYASRMGFKGKG